MLGTGTSSRRSAPYSWSLYDLDFCRVVSYTAHILESNEAFAVCCESILLHFIAQNAGQALTYLLQFFFSPHCGNATSVRDIFTNVNQTIG